MTVRCWASVLAACLVSAPCADSAASHRQPLPLDLAVQVRYRDRTSPVRRIEEVSEAVVEEIAGRGCYRRVAADAEGVPGALRLLITLNDVKEETVYDVPLAVREASHNPEDALKFTAVVEVGATVEIFGPDRGDPALRSRQFHAERRVRPRTANQEVIESAWRLVTEEIARSARRVACGVKPRALGLAER